MNTALWLAAIALIVIGIVGTVVPALPGVAFVFGGIVLAAWIDDFQRISGWTIGLLAILAALGFVVDYSAAVVSARRAGASRLGILGAAIGTVAGIFTGLVGLIFMPLVGAFAGELIANRDALRAGRVGLASWVGLLVGAVLKIGVVFMMLAIFLAALFL
jgi:uncharacterized protein